MYMGSTKRRTSFALDLDTIDRLRLLARHWHVSQAEVVRRAVKLAAEKGEREEVSVRERLREYRTSGKVNPESAATYLAQIRDGRNR